MEAEDVIEGLPLNKNASPKQMIYLALIFATLLLGGWKAKAYFDEWHHDLLAQIEATGRMHVERVHAIEVNVEHNTGAIAAIQKYFWSNRDQQQWANKLDKMNRTVGQVLIVPDVPPPEPAR